MHRDTHRSRRLLLALSASAICAAAAGCSETPQSAFETIVRYGETGQYAKVWDRIDKKSQGKLEPALELFAKLGAAGAAIAGDRQKAKELSELKGKDLFVRLCSESEEAREHFVKQRVKSAAVQGDRATLTVLAQKDGKEQERTVVMIKEDGIWKMSVDQ